MERFDVLVVGAGPAGSATAMRLARGGARVLLADRARFPRDKPCGGGLTGRALRHAPCDVSPVVEHVVDRFVLRAGYRTRVARRSPTPVILMTQRRKLDAYLAEQATAAGADFRDGAPVSEIVIEAGSAHATVGESRIEASYVVGADGANGIVARSTGLGAGIRPGVALEGNVSWGDLEPAPYRGTAWVELGVVPGRLRVGLSEGRPRQPGSGWMAGRGAEAPLASRPARSSARARAGSAQRRPRASAPDATAHLALRERTRASRR